MRSKTFEGTPPNPNYTDLKEKEKMQATEEVKTSRKRTERRRTYERKRESELPQGLISHFIKDEWELRLVRYLIQGEDDYRSIDGRLSEGYEFVRPEEIPQEYLSSFKIVNGQRGGIVAVGDLCLMKVDTHLRKDRRRHYEQVTKEQLASVDINVLTKKGFQDLGTRSKLLNKEPTFQGDN